MTYKKLLMLFFFIVFDARLGPEICLFQSPTKHLSIEVWKNGWLKTCNLFCKNLLQNELTSDVARFTTQQPDLLQDRFYVDGKTRNIAIQLVLQ